MYSNKENVNILTALLVKYGIRHAVVCPGSRNAPIVHNFDVCPGITCYPVTDERSAGFYALGLAQALRQPVVVCVTSGTALLNVAPAVAEAWYQYRQLVVISADRPQAWIDQHDGQTLPQTDALGHFVAKTVTLPEIPDSPNDTDKGRVELRWYCNRLVCEALMAVRDRAGRPVHINVPISEPLFQFNVAQLPDERVVSRTQGRLIHDDLMTKDGGLLRDFWKARRRMIVVGQDDDFAVDMYWPLWRQAAVLHESLSGGAHGAVLFDQVLAAAGDNPSLMPDFVLYGGGTLVSKRIKKFLRRTTDVPCWEVSRDGQLHDTFMHATGVLFGEISDVLRMLNDIMEDAAADKQLYRDSLGAMADSSAFVSQWQLALDQARCHAESFEPPYSQMAAVRLFEQRVAWMIIPPVVHYGNSTAVRLANIYSQGQVYCNRGVNGIEGSLSTAAGYSLGVNEMNSKDADRLVCCVLGDLSFFYDQNALWNRNLGGNLRVLLLNNGGGGIFRRLPGLENSPARERLVAAVHQTTAEGICRQNNVCYRRAENMKELADGICQLLTDDLSRPMVLEVITDSVTDQQALETFERILRS